MTTDEKPWLEKVRQFFDASADVNWPDRLAVVSQQLGLPQPLLTTLPDRPMWFNGNVEAVQPGKWIMVISLNHQLPGKPVQPNDPWAYCLNHNTKEWYARFFRPLVKLASAATGLQVTDEKDFATRSMVFVELVPYASQSFSLTQDQVVDLLATDAGCRTQQKITNLLIDQASPALILVNGNRAVEAFQTSSADRLTKWDLQTYTSANPNRPLKQLWHYEGILEGVTGKTPVLAFPFLRSMNSHNANVEIDQLGAYGRRLMQSLRADS